MTFCGVLVSSLFCIDSGILSTTLGLGGLSISQNPDHEQSPSFTHMPLDTPAPSDDMGPGDNVGLIVAIVMGAILLALAVVGVFLQLIIVTGRKRRNEKNTNGMHQAEWSSSG